MTDTGLYMSGYKQGQFDAHQEVLEAKAELAALKRQHAELIAKGMELEEEPQRPETPYERGWKDGTAKAAKQTRLRFQDIVSWQPGESRNRLVCDIADFVESLAPTEETKG